MFEIELLGTVITDEIQDYLESISNIPGASFDLERVKFYTINFYNIDHISPFEFDGFSLVCSGGVVHIVYIAYDILKEDIHKARLTNFN